MHNVIDFFVEFYKKFEEGKIFLSSGTHAIKIATRGTPVQVWLSEEDSSGIPVCGGDINYYGLSKVDDGFILYAQVNSDSVSFAWQAVFETN